MARRRFDLCRKEDVVNCGEHFGRPFCVLFHVFQPFRSYPRPAGSIGGLQAISNEFALPDEDSTVINCKFMRDSGKC
jgi:hypothetical protein